MGVPSTSLTCDSCCGPAKRRQHLRREQFDRLCHLRVRQTADVDLSEEPIESEEFALVHELVNDLLGTADENWARGTGAPLVDVTRNFASKVRTRRMFAEIGAVVGIELVQGRLRLLRHVDMGRYRDLPRARVVSFFSMTLPIGGNLADEVGWRLGDVRKDERQAEFARPQRALLDCHQRRARSAAFPPAAAKSRS